MMEKMIDFANVKAGDNPILFAGDVNCSMANPANGVDADFAGNCRLWIDDGFASIKKGLDSRKQAIYSPSAPGNSGPHEAAY